MTRSFFTPIPVTFRSKKGAVLSDSDLLRAWAHVRTEDIDAEHEQTSLQKMVLDSNSRAIRQRVLALRKARKGSE